VPRSAGTSRSGPSNDDPCRFARAASEARGATARSAVSRARSALARLALATLDAYGNRRGPPRPQSPALWGLEVDSDGGLAWGGCRLEQLARDFGTPLHVVDATQLERSFRSFRDAFAARYPRVDVAYSYKTNPLPGVLRELHGFGASAEVISHLELWLALQLGVPAHKIVFNGPAKTPEALELAVRRGVKLINIDGIEEIARIDELASLYGRKQRVGVRIITSVGWASQFGFRVRGDEALRAFERIKKCRHLRPAALHVHLGTSLRTPETHAQASREAIEFAETLRTSLGIVLEHIDLGGGFGVPTVKALSQIELRLLGAGYPVRPPTNGFAVAEFAAAICAAVETYSARPEPGRSPELILEPGRALTSGSQALLLSVLSAKAGDRGVRYAIADGGRNLTMPLAYEYHEVFVANRMRLDAPTSRQTVFGPLCHPADVVVAGRELPSMEAGDVLAVMDAGAYFIPNQMTFSHPRPAVVMITGGTPRLIREREAFKDVVAHDVFGSAPTSALSNVDSRA